MALDKEAIRNALAEYKQTGAVGANYEAIALAAIDLWDIALTVPSCDYCKSAPATRQLPQFRGTSLCCDSCNKDYDGGVELPYATALRKVFPGARNNTTT
jgi:hypothetical protein